MSEPRRDEKYQDEKGRGEKQEKGRDESWDEKWRRDPVEAATWAFILIWVGVVWLVSNTGFLDNLFGDATGWVGIGFLGAGLIILLAVGARLVMPAWRRPVTGSIILGLIFIGIGLGNLVNWEIVVPLILIGIGLVGLAAFFFRNRE